MGPHLCSSLMDQPLPNTKHCVTPSGRAKVVKLPMLGETMLLYPGTPCISFGTRHWSLARPQLASLARTVEFTEKIICSRDISMHQARIQQCSFKIMLSSKINQLKGIFHSIKHVNRMDIWLVTRHSYERVVTGQIQNAHVV